jgi:hypothetical protein
MKNIITLDNNFSYGYDQGSYNLRKSKNSQFNCYYAKAKRFPRSFREECISVCEQISQYANSQGRIPIILLSGGLDSEVVLRSFVESGKDFIAMTHRFKNDLNDHELYYVDRLAKKFSIEIIYRDIDIENWLVSSDQSYTMAHLSKCTRAEMLPTMKLIHDCYFEFGGTPVLGNGDFYASRDIDPYKRMEDNSIEYQWYYIEFEYILAWMRYCVAQGIIGSINFFQQTPEIVLSMALDPLIQELFNEDVVGKHSTRSSKYLVYKKYWRDIELRKKYHGGEKISGICDHLQKSFLNKNYYYYKNKWKMPVDEFIKGLMLDVA